MRSFQCSPLRYPGGKQKLYPFVVQLMEEWGGDFSDYAEPYAGGAGVAIALLINKVVDRVHLNDYSYQVHAFWHSILNETEEFCRRISKVSLTIEEWKRQREVYRNYDSNSRFDVGFSMFYLNRCNRSGIATAGVIGGMAQSGNYKIDARFNRSELIRRIQVIASFKKRIRLRNWDALKFVNQYLTKLPENSFVYFDPPYFHKADRLYENHYSPHDHADVAQTIMGSDLGFWMVSYDAAPEICDLYCKCQALKYTLQYSASEVRKGTEVIFIPKNLPVPIIPKLAVFPQ